MGRWTTRIERLGQRWLYALVAIPVLTKIIETGGWPRTPREWLLTEVVAGLVIAALVGCARNTWRCWRWRGRTPHGPGSGRDGEMLRP